MTSSRAGERPRPYHHGDLRRALLDAAVRAVGETGPAALSLRDLARRAGVSHAAPAYHFGDKAGLLSAVAADGFRLLAATLREAYQATGSFLEVGVAYVRFAVTHRAHFEVMFRPELYRPDDPEVAAAREAARSLLYPPVAELTEDRSAASSLRAGVAAWSLVHGLATLWLNGNLPPQLGDDPEQIAREVARYLFSTSSAP
jgi:AcrR family transcriptional regulator